MIPPRFPQMSQIRPNLPQEHALDQRRDAERRSALKKGVWMLREQLPESKQMEFMFQVIVESVLMLGVNMFTVGENIAADMRPPNK